MKKVKHISIFVSLLAISVLACDDEPEPNATPRVEEIGQYCLDTKIAVENCIQEEGSANDCVFFKQAWNHNPELHFAWTAYEECVTEVCGCEGVGMDETDMCLKDEIIDRDSLTWNSRCGKILDLCVGMSEASFYWAD